MDFRLVLSHLGDSTKRHFGGYSTFDDAYQAIVTMAQKDSLIPGDTASIEHSGEIVATYIIQENRHPVNAVYYEI